jgi:hypothetical protein
MSIIIDFATSNILGANSLLATLDIPPRMSRASKLFAPNLDKRRIVANHTYAAV